MRSARLTEKREPFRTMRERGSVEETRRLVSGDGRPELRAESLECIGRRLTAAATLRVVDRHRPTWRGQLEGHDVGTLLERHVAVPCVTREDEDADFVARR